MKKVFTIISLSVLLISVLLVHGSNSSFDRKSAFKPKIALFTGDLVFQSNMGGQGLAISLATNSPYTHVGMIVMKDGIPFVFEAVQPVRMTPLSQWATYGTNNEYVIKRHPQTQQVLSDKSIQKQLEEFIKQQLNKNYDILFEWSDEKMYCSELIWKVYHEVFDIELCPTRPLSSYDFSNTVVIEEALKRYGKTMKDDEPIVAPSDLFEAEDLYLVGPK